MEIPEVLETGGLNWSIIDQIQIGRWALPSYTVPESFHSVAAIAAEIQLKQVLQVLQVSYQANKPEAGMGCFMAAALYAGEPSTSTRTRAREEA